MYVVLLFMRSKKYLSQIIQMYKAGKIINSAQHIVYTITNQDWVNF